MSQSTGRSTADTRGRTAVQKAALGVGVVFLLVGVLGFIPGITTNYDTMSFASHHSEAKLLGIFQVSILHNIVHLLFGIAGIALSRTWDSARTYLLGSGVIYIVLLVYGLLVDVNSDSNFIPFNNADDLLHLVLAIGLLASWFVSKEADTTTREDRPATTTPMP
jgi:Domain of unknown function (DUF4383)